MSTTPNYTFRRGAVEYVSVPSVASTAYSPGDLMFLDTGNVAKPASSFTWSTDLATTQPLFRAKFLGVCQDQKLATDVSTRDVLIATKGTFNYPCVALGAALGIGSFVNCAKDTGNNLLDQRLANVATTSLAIGTLAENAATGATSLVVYLQSFLVYTAL